MKYILCILGFVVVLGIGGLNGVDGLGPCGRISPEAEAMKVASCVPAGRNKNIAVPRRCCLRVRILAQKPSCLCAVMLSTTAKTAGINAEVAITIPKRCNLADRPVGYRCGGYRLP